MAQRAWRIGQKAKRIMLEGREAGRLEGEGIATA